jgi:biopolymer transport protein ExbD
MSYPVSKSNKKQIRKPRSTRNLKALKPQLTSLVDAMTIILIYLLKSFTSEGQIITPAKNLVLPESSAQKNPELTVVIAVNNDVIMAEDQPIIAVDKVLSSESPDIPELGQWLKNRREMTQKIEQYSTKTKFKGDVTIQGDKKIRFHLLKKIMYTCGQQEFNNFYLAVRKVGG